MRIVCIIFVLIFAVIGCQSFEGNPEQEKNVAKEKAENKKEQESDERIVYYQVDGVNQFLVEELLSIVDGEYVFDPIHRTLEISINDDRFFLVDGVNVLERNGEYLPTDEIFFRIEKEELYLPEAFLRIGMNLDVSREDGVFVFNWQGPVTKVGGPPEEFNFENWDAEKMVEYLSFLETPIKGAKVSTIPSHLPGAKRPYRNGYHEGIDWYDFASGGNITTETPIYAMAEGVVVRADHDYQEYGSPEERNKDLKLTASLGETPLYIFDKLRGRQVWVQYPNGVMNRFAHLHEIPEDIYVGKRVDANTIIGYVGNSGTSGSVNKDLSGLHLHQDLLIYGELFWKPLNQEEVREVLVRIFDR